MTSSEIKNKIIAPHWKFLALAIMVGGFFPFIGLLIFLFEGNQVESNIYYLVFLPFIIGTIFFIFITKKNNAINFERTSLNTLILIKSFKGEIDLIEFQKRLNISLNQVSDVINHLEKRGKIEVLERNNNLLKVNLKVK